VTDEADVRMLAVVRYPILIFYAIDRRERRSHYPACPAQRAGTSLIVANRARGDGSNATSIWRKQVSRTGNIGRYRCEMIRISKSASAKLCESPRPAFAGRGRNLRSEFRVRGSIHELVCGESPSSRPSARERAGRRRRRREDKTPGPRGGIRPSCA